MSKKRVETRVALSGVSHRGVRASNVCNKKGCDSWPYVGLLHNWELRRIWEYWSALLPKLNVNKVLNTQMGSPELMSSQKCLSGRAERAKPILTVTGSCCIPFILRVVILNVLISRIRTL